MRNQLDTAPELLFWPCHSSGSNALQVKAFAVLSWLEAGGKPSTWLPPGRLVEHYQFFSKQNSKKRRDRKTKIFKKITFEIFSKFYNIRSDWNIYFHLVRKSLWFFDYICFFLLSSQSKRHKSRQNQKNKFLNLL